MQDVQLWFKNQLVFYREMFEQYRQSPADFVFVEQPVRLNLWDDAVLRQMDDVQAVLNSCDELDLGVPASDDEAGQGM